MGKFMPNKIDSLIDEDSFKLLTDTFNEQVSDLRLNFIEQINSLENDFIDSQNIILKEAEEAIEMQKELYNKELINIKEKDDNYNIILPKITKEYNESIDKENKKLIEDKEILKTITLKERDNSIQEEKDNYKKLFEKSNIDFN